MPPEKVPDIDLSATPGRHRVALAVNVLPRRESVDQMAVKSPFAIRMLTASRMVVLPQLLVPTKQVDMTQILQPEAAKAAEILDAQHFLISWFGHPR